VRCGAACDDALLRARISEIRHGWGEFGRAAVDDDLVLGFVKCAPVSFFPQTRWLPTGAPEPSVPLLACLHVREETRSRGLEKVLLHAVMRDLHARGERELFAYGVSGGTHVAPPMPDLKFLLEQGFVIERPHAQYPLLKLEVKSLAAWTESLESALGFLLPPLSRPQRVPAPSAE
jgi:GNAT superfamily N-acetyltransferase